MLAAESLAIAPQELPLVRRMELPDLEGMGVWLVHRLQQRHSQASSAQILGWLRTCLYSNEMWFVRTDHCCGLARMVREPLAAQPVAEEVFVLAQHGFEEEAEFIYPKMASWAAHHEASRLEVERHTDVERNMIRGQLGKLVLVHRPHLVLTP